MFIELVDSLRCLERHDETWLVAGVTRMDGRHIVDGVLGCPICRREYPVHDGIAWFTTPSAPDSARVARAPVAADSEWTTRAAALLGLSEGGGIVCLGGEWIDCADALSALEPSHVVVLNAQPDASSSQVISAIMVDDRLPFGAGTVRAAALGGEASQLLASTAECLRSRGRLVGPVTADVPAGVVELARDADHWVAERDALASPPVPLRSARR
jgi:uncharacterized protein YbaR (Trm112 family)